MECIRVNHFWIKSDQIYCYQLRGQNHNSLKLRGLKLLLSQKYITINSSQQVNQIIPTEKSQLNYIK